MRNYAIIGGGPRGLYALESLYLALFNSESNKEVKVTLFEPFAYPGAGWVWNPEQVTTNWLNITERGLQGLKGRPEIQFGTSIIPGFPSYSDWIEKEKDTITDNTPDTFPPRAKMGTYLNARFETIVKALQGFGLLLVIKEKVVDIKYIPPHFEIITKQQSIKGIDEIVLTVGHQDTELSEQLKKWQEHAKENKVPQTFTEPYPVEKILQATIDKTTVVGFRGFGLATIDLLRALTIKKGAHFEILNEHTREVAFKPSEKHPEKFVPFSLDGLPMVPKPLNKTVDDLFAPSEDALSAFAKAVNQGACGEHTAKHHYFLLESMAEVVVPIFLSLGSKAIEHDYTSSELYYLAINYISNKEIDHPLLLSHKLPTLEMMQDQVGMAIGEVQITLDYCIGQVWRHCQPTIYSEFSYPELPDAVVAEVIALDEASKRYTYGPPVESIQQLIALTKAGYLDLSVLKDPDINLHNEGWKLKLEEQELDVHTMINAVLDAPELVKVNTTLIQNLLKDKMIEPKHTDLGIRTDDYGYVEVPEDKSFVPLAVLGRLSKGSVIGVDAILECFGKRITSWANHSIKCMLEK
ncbi:FAD/NAD(P)-binding protein [Dokdonia sp. Hel_I_53]|uniref:FAD/NAD(P)-binding protein n=1 Tax=Dokdonia sp. Hel_I_53 TaxID=1566287 RepID=UPI00119C29C5|nr:FAD/NAD(P)-binding protein [Dokdonia sp. Hel_I_53]TVZ50994.1 FAD-NAD(P)-binding protein [Dokdonia sp. Hel_I_53]